MARLGSWPCYFNENNKTLSTSGDEDDKTDKIFPTDSKLMLMISVFFISFSVRFYSIYCMTLLTHSLKIEVYTDDPFS